MRGSGLAGRLVLQEHAGGRVVGAGLAKSLLNQLFDRDRFNLAEAVARQETHLIDKPAHALDTVIHRGGQ